MGWHASDTHGLTFTGCRVPEANLLGARGRGFANFLATLDDGRIAIAALALGTIEACLEHSVAYAKDRHAFGKPIGSYQAVAFKCADLAVMAATARTLVYEAAWRKDTGRPFKQHAAMAKLYATEGAVTATREATQIFGGYGFMDETPVSSVLPGLQDPRDRRGHERGAAPRDQPRAGPRRRFLNAPARYRRAP